MTSGPQTTQTVDYRGTNPEEYRMTVGEHLDELRRRLLLGLVGLFVAVIVCMLFGERVIVTFCTPLVRELHRKGINPQIYYTQISGAFMTYLKISLITAFAMAGPWILFQIWQFVAAGLYPNERKIVTKYIPLSVTLLTGGMVFVYFIVMPWTIRFLLEFGGGLPLPIEPTPTINLPVDHTPSKFDVFDGDPDKPVEGEYWLNRHDGRLKTFVMGEIKVIPFGPTSLAAPMITMPDYIDLVLLMMVTFGLAFQLPLVVLAVARIGIVDTTWLRKSRRYVYFAMTLISAVLAPADVVTAMLALLIPLILLYEFGIVLADWGKKEREAAARDEDSL